MRRNCSAGYCNPYPVEAFASVDGNPSEWMACIASSSRPAVGVADKDCQKGSLLRSPLTRRPVSQAIDRRCSQVLPWTTSHVVGLRKVAESTGSVRCRAMQYWNRVARAWPQLLESCLERDLVVHVIEPRARLLRCSLCRRPSSDGPRAIAIAIVTGRCATDVR